MRWVYERGAEKPVGEIWHRSRTGELVDFSSGIVDWELKIGKRGAKALVTKTTGIDGAAGSGTPESGTPNVTVTWEAGDLDIPGGDYDLTIRARDGSTLDRIIYGRITIKESIK